VGLIGLLIALGATIVLAAILAVAYIAAGVDDPTDAASFDFAAIAAQSLAFVLAALLMTRRLHPSAREFGFRSFKPSAFGWALLALFSYFAVAIVYGLIVQPPEDDLTQQLGADESTTLAIITGVFVIGVAPIVEEFFFRGFLYQALRTRAGVVGGAVASGLIFGGIHLKPEYLFPLAALGTVLALLFHKTGSLWPCVLVHAANNALALAVTL